MFMKLTRILNCVGLFTDNDSRQALFLSETTPFGYTREPTSVKNFLLGNNVTFHWIFSFGSMPHTYFEEMIFGETDNNDRIMDKYISLYPDLSEIKNPTVPYSLRKRLSVVSKTITATKISVQFQIQNANINDASPKTYGCKVYFDYYDYRSGPVELAVSPSIVIWRNSYSVATGGTVHLNCDADGLPLPYVTWMKGGTVLQNSTTNYQYDISNIQSFQAGNYTCIATNIGGSVSHNIDVIVST
ncbi:hemicentin-2-like isoform X1 [Acropora millepora]|uniref:hemicentin-2-like isoform X1 n=1 Tax=Acropora millepora TaxID=45264 RepID=UPI0010FCD48D|nr:hemicentin-2-like isoform X1 [Acropora millepora]